MPDETFTIFPHLGRKTDVPANDASLFREGIYTHDVGGMNFDLYRRRRASTKSQGYQKWSNSVNAQATKCLGLFELNDGSNQDYIMFDNGKVFVYDAARDPQIVQDGGSTTFAKDNVDLYSIIRLGSYMAFSDRGENTPYKWKNGDANLTKLIASGTEYTFRYMVVFKRRVIGLYSDQTDGRIDVRWSTDFPTTAITSLNFPGANQLYIPNDDTITGGVTMGQDRMFIYCENSINQMVYQPDFELPFSLYTVVADQGFSSHQSIVTVDNSHYGFNKSYGFCEYRGGNEFPYGGRPISADIEFDLRDINWEYYNLIVGTFLPLTRQIVWTVPLTGQTTPDRLLFYNIDSKQWTVEDKAMRYLSQWQTDANFTWNDLITELGGTGALWSAAGTDTWAYYTAGRQRLVYANTNGHTYFQTGETLDGSALDGYRIEPILDFGQPELNTFIRQVFFDLGVVGDYDLVLNHRSGDTVGELNNTGWTEVGTLSLDSPDRPIFNVALNGRLHQFKWGTTGASEKFEVHKITFKYENRSNI